jgi:D-serine deaminase-like pyridoxal phosphate-dependent protein
VRAGVYTFFDLVMAGIGVCEKTDIASSVVTTIIGQNKDKGWFFIDAGWMALSSDRGTAKQPQDCGYGLVATTDGQIINGLQVIKVNQEHGIIGSALPGTINFDNFPIGLKIHILPNHACATSAMHCRYHVFDKVNQEHGIIGSALPGTINFDNFPIGLKIHILPNHACATSAMHRRYHVFDKVNQTYESWVRIQGW